MLKEKIQWSPHRQYESATEWEPIDFFSECLCNSKRFDLKLGFFSSSAIRTLSDGFALFLHHGGTMRLIINNILSSQDKNAIIAGTEENPATVFDLSDITALKNTLSESDKFFFDCLAWLISEKRIEIKIIAPKDTEGIAHTKEGVFADENNIVGFNGSCNFSRTALLENKESIDVNCDWDGEISNAKLKNTISKFEKTFSENDESVQYIEPKEIITNIAKIFGGKDVEELLEIENELFGGKKSMPVRQTIKNALDKARKQVEKTIEKVKEEDSKPKFPYPQGAREYQQSAFENWKNNNQQGLFAMATGTGKTITSLNCLLHEYYKTNFYKALILVPTMSLVEQWEKECSKFNFTKNIIKVYSANDWLKQLSSLETLKLLNKDFSFIIIATYASFLTKKFQNQFKQLDENTLLIADECHNMGSPNILTKLKSIHLQKRIGLSATPDRQYQEEINNTIREFFGEKPENSYTFSYSMEDAIKKEPRALCPYRYYPKIVRLTDTEFKEYVDYTRRIVTMHPRNDEEKEIFNRLCIARQRIIHKAENKLDAFKSILQEEYTKRQNLKYTLVYVPEGLADEDEIFDASKTDILRETDADRNLLNLYTRTIGELFDNVPVKQFIGSTSSDDRKKILQDFANGNLQVITSMKCLDEGIDVPRSELAIFCASTGNPRQFIQRRGRILRLSAGKDEAVIYDLVVVPNPSGDDSLFKTKQSEVAKELRRIRDFAEMSENKHYTQQILGPILKYYQLTL
ncbi:ATP-dependent RNA helicase DbpA [termite gut metagenome]|uniref:ATP-dependent RNA helicase DbpA n=1 Tax=termite gut metagenome TaxID=433724 RepID=A0A5J4RTJ3_9ZZZZ